MKNRRNIERPKKFSLNQASGLAMIIVLCLFIAPFQIAAQKNAGQNSPCKNEPPPKVSSRPALVIKNVTVIDGTGTPPKSDMAVVIKGDRIAEISPAKTVKTPKGAKIIDAGGKYLIPGLWDMHVHLKNSTASALPVFMANGITSVRDMVGGFEELAEMRRRVEAGEIIGPRIKFSGPALESPASVERAKASGKKENFDLTRIVVAKPEDAAGAIKKLKDMGVDFIKIRTWASPEVYFAVMKAAKDAGMQIVGHSPETLDPVKVAEAGQASFEHGFYPYPLSKYSTAERENIIEAFVKNRVAIVPTLVAWNYRTVPLETAKAIIADEANQIDDRRRYTSPELIEYWGVQLETQKPASEESLKGWTNAIDTMAGDIGAMFKKGVRVMPGTDLAGPLVFPGFSLHDELEMFVTKIGMSPMETIESATRVPAEFLGMEDCLGTIEKGKIADLVLLDADPLKDINNIRIISGVIKNGKYFDKTELEKILAAVEQANQLNPVSSEVIKNSPVIIDGTLSEIELKGAKKIELTGGGEAFYKADGDAVYIGVRGVGDGWITIYVTDGRDIYALHASAALGTAVYKNENGTWKNIQGFNYVARDPGMSAEAVKVREEFYKTNGWVANVGRMGKPNEREFKISKKFAGGQKMKMAIVYAADTNPISRQIFPKTLADDTMNMELVRGDTPAELKFDPESWALIEP